MALQTIVSFLKKHKNIVFFLAVLIGFFVFSTHGVFAAEDAAAGAGISKADSDKLIGYMNMALKACAAILGLVTSFISIFLYPGWVNGTMFGLQDYLKEIWILVSNVVYFIFAGILITIAFMNIIGKGDGTWELKQAMPKFIIGVLIVPFSWFMVQFLLSLSAILTVGVLTLPYNSFQNETLFQGAMANSKLANQQFCKDIIISFSGNFEKGATSVAEGDEAFQENIKCKNEGSKVSIKEIISGEGAGEGIDNGVFGIISVYTYGILRVQELDTIAKGDLTTVKGISDLIFKIIFDLLFVVVYMLLMVALFLALMVRGIRLWVFMMLSPIFGLLYFLGKTGDGSGKMEKFSPKEFVALALVPVYVAAALAFGLTFIMVASEGIKEKSKSTDMDTLSAGGFSISIIGAHADGEEEKSVIAKLIVELFGVVVLWIAVMAALGASKTTEAIVAPIASFGESVGKLVTSAPAYAPIIPTGGGGAMSVTGLASLGSTIQGDIHSKFQQKGSTFAQSITNPSEENKKYQTYDNASINTEKNSYDTIKGILGVGDSNTLVNSQAGLKALSKNLEKIKLHGTYGFNNPAKADELIKAIEKSSGNPAELRRILSELDGLAKSPQNSILGGTEKVVTSQVDQYMGKTGAEEPLAGDTTNNKIEINSTISPLISGGKISGATDVEKEGNISTIANDITRMLSGEKISIDKMKGELTKIGITNSGDQDKVIDALNDSIE